MTNKIEPKFTFDDDFADVHDLFPPALSASERQVGGDHYTKLAIQPIEYSMANKLNALQHTAIKYITRYDDKGTPLLDLTKAIHCIEMLIEYEIEE
jgi:hypothetical protein